MLLSNAIRDLFLVIAAKKGIEVFWMYVEGERLIYYNKLIYICIELGAIKFSC